MAICSSLQTSFLSLCSLILFIKFFRIIWSSFYSKKKKHLPPSPWKLPVIGNFHQLGSNPNQSLQVLSRKHGPIMLLHFGSIPTLVASSAESAREIMKVHDISFASRPSLTIPNIVVYGSKDIAFSPYGEYWRQLKSTVVVNLLSNSRVKSFQQVREKEIGLMIGVVEESCGSLVNMSSLLVSLTNTIICRVTLGQAYDGLKLPDLVKKFLNILTVFSVGSYIPWLSWVDRLSGLQGNAKRIAKEVDEFLEDDVEEHLNKKRSVVHEGQDFVDILLDVQRDNTIDFNFHRDTLKAVILDMFVAGTDTTYTTLEWTLGELIKHPRVMKKLQHEVTQTAQGRTMIQEEDLENMQYIKAVLKESLRLHPPVPLLLPRQSTQDVKMKGYDIPTGTQVIINAWAIGRDPDTWEEPEEFRPERFLSNSIANNYNGLNFEWLPFGSGRRGCPGIQFAVVIMELALANLVYKFDFTLPHGVKNEDLDFSEKFGITLHMKSAIMVIATPRL